jgi:hypothetical protein
MPPKCLIQFVKGRMEPTENAPLTNVEEEIPSQPAQISRRQAEPVRLLQDSRRLGCGDHGKGRALLPALILAKAGAVGFQRG